MSSLWTHFGLPVTPIPGSFRHVAGGSVVDVSCSDPRTTVTSFTANAVNVVDRRGESFNPSAAAVELRSAAARRQDAAREVFAARRESASAAECACARDERTLADAVFTRAVKRWEATTGEEFNPSDWEAA